MRRASTSWVGAEPSAALRTPRHLVAHHRPPRPVVDTTRSHAAEHQLRYRYAGTDDEPGTHPALDAKRLTLMIAQTMAIEFPDHVLSLTSMMSSTGEPEFGQSTPEAQEVLFSPRPADRDGYIAAAERELVWASRRYGDAAALRALAAASYDRSYYPAGVPRQLAAMILDGSRATPFGSSTCRRSSSTARTTP
jgi:hypothetical protein